MVRLHGGHLIYEGIRIVCSRKPLKCKGNAMLLQSNVTVLLCIWNGLRLPVNSRRYSKRRDFYIANFREADRHNALPVPYISDAVHRCSFNLLRFASEWTSRLSLSHTVTLTLCPFSISQKKTKNKFLIKNGKQMPSKLSRRVRGSRQQANQHGAERPLSVFGPGKFS